MSTLVPIVAGDSHPIRGADSDDPYVGMKEHLAGSLIGATDAVVPTSIRSNTKRVFWVCMLYNRDSATPNPSGYSYTYGSTTPDISNNYVEQGKLHCVFEVWLDTAVQNAIDTTNEVLREVKSGGTSDNRTLCWGFADDVDQVSTLVAKFSSNNEGAYPRVFPWDPDAGPAAPDPMPGIAGNAQVAVWCYMGTSNRTFSTNVNWTDAYNGNWINKTSEKGAAYADGQATFDHSTGTVQALFSYALVVEFNTPSVGRTVTGVNNGAPIREGNSYEAEQTQNYVTGTAFQTNGDATGFTLGGSVAQPNFVVVSDQRVEFDTEIGNLPFGSVDGLLEHPDGNVAVPGLPISPPLNWTYGAMTGVTAPADVRSIVNLWDDVELMGATGNTVAALTIGDQISYETLDGALTIDLSDGRWTWAPAPETGLDPALDGYGFQIKARRAADANNWSNPVPVIVNGKSRITSVGGVTAGSGVFDFDDVNTEIFGLDFTDVPGKVFIQVAFGDKRDDDLNLGLAVEQPGGYGAGDWTDNRVVQPAWNRGALPAGVRYAIFVVPGGDIT